MSEGKTKELVVDMPESGEMRSEALRMVLQYPNNDTKSPRPNQSLRIIKLKAKLLKSSRNTLMKSMVLTGTALLVSLDFKFVVIWRVE